MTQRRNEPDRLSNYFDNLLDGIGSRGSSFSDIDSCIGCTHDGKTDRYLIQEFKRHGEALTKGQAWCLNGLALKPGITTWIVRLTEDEGTLHLTDMRLHKEFTVSTDQYRELFRAWWSNRLEKEFERLWRLVA